MIIREEPQSSFGTYQQRALKRLWCMCEELLCPVFVSFEPTKV